MFPRTKTGKPRVIELDIPTTAALRSWKARQSEERLAIGSGYRDLDLVFTRPDGRPYHPEAFSKTFDRRLRQSSFAELPIIRLHDLRHTWATLARFGRRRGREGRVRTSRALLPNGHLADVPARGERHAD